MNPILTIVAITIIIADIIIADIIIADIIIADIIMSSFVKCLLFSGLFSQPICLWFRPSW